MRVTNIRRGLVPLVIAAFLTGCSTDGGVDPFDLTVQDMGELACAEARDARESLNDALNAPEDSGQRRGVDDWGLDPENEADIQRTIDELDERIAVCDDQGDGDAVEPSESESTSEPTPSADPTDDESSDGSDSEPDPVEIIGWDQLVEDTPAGLEESIEDHASETDFDWTDVETWAEARMPQGKLVDARIAVMFGQAGLTDEEVRERTGVARDVPVVRAKRCYTVLDTDDDVCLSGDDRLQVVLTPVVLDGDEVKGLQPESGVVLTEGFPLVTYDRR